jgi:replication factor C small subunit
MKDHGLLVEKYRPTSLDNYVGNENIKKTISKFLKQNDLANMLFAGPAGSGKTTLAKLIVKNLDCEYILINASDENGIDTIRDKVKGFASAASFTPLKVVILDEADFLTIQAQASLRNVIEQFSRTTRFILTCNYVERIIDPIQSRCQVLKIVPPSKKECAIHVSGILEQEGIRFEMEDLAVIVNKCYPDLRKCLNSVQVSTHESKLTIDKEILVSSNYTAEVLKELSKSKPNFRTVRQIIADSGQNQFEELFKFLFENSSKFAEGNEGSVAIHINEHQYQSQFAIDKEINAMSLIAKLISSK